MVAPIITRPSQPQDLSTSCFNDSLDGVAVEQISHPLRPDDVFPAGHFFYFNGDHWSALIGVSSPSLWSGRQYDISQERSGTQVWTGQVVLNHSNSLGCYGYKASAPAGGQWQIGDVLSIDRSSPLRRSLTLFSPPNSESCVSGHGMDVRKSNFPNWSESPILLGGTPTLIHSPIQVESTTASSQTDHSTDKSRGVAHVRSQEVDALACDLASSNHLGGGLRVASQAQASYWNEASCNRPMANGVPSTPDCTYQESSHMGTQTIWNESLTDATRTTAHIPPYKKVVVTVPSIPIHTFIQTGENVQESVSKPALDTRSCWSSSQKAELGIYEIVHAIHVKESSSTDSRNIAELFPQLVVRVLEIQDFEDRVGARIEEPPGWISIINKNTGVLYAAKVSDGIAVSPRVGVRLWDEVDKIAPRTVHWEVEQCQESVDESRRKYITELPDSQVVDLLREVPHATQQQLQTMVTKPVVRDVKAQLERRLEEARLQVEIAENKASENAAEGRNLELLVDELRGRLLETTQALESADVAREKDKIDHTSTINVVTREFAHKETMIGRLEAQRLPGQVLEAEVAQSLLSKLSASEHAVDENLQQVIKQRHELEEELASLRVQQLSGQVAEAELAQSLLSKLSASEDAADESLKQVTRERCELQEKLAAASLTLEDQSQEIVSLGRTLSKRRESKEELEYRLQEAGLQVQMSEKNALEDAELGRNMTLYADEMHGRLEGANQALELMNFVTQELAQRDITLERLEAQHLSTQLREAELAKSLLSKLSASESSADEELKHISSERYELEEELRSARLAFEGQSQGIALSEKTLADYQNTECQLEVRLEAARVDVQMAETRASEHGEVGQKMKLFVDELRGRLEETSQALQSTDLAREKDKETHTSAMSVATQELQQKETMIERLEAQHLSGQAAEAELAQSLLSKLASSEKSADEKLQQFRNESRDLEEELASARLMIEEHDAVHSGALVEHREAEEQLKGRLVQADLLVEVAEHEVLEHSEAGHKMKRLVDELVARLEEATQALETNNTAREKEIADHSSAMIALSEELAKEREGLDLLKHQHLAEWHTESGIAQKLVKELAEFEDISNERLREDARCCEEEFAKKLEMERRSAEKKLEQAKAALQLDHRTIERGMLRASLEKERMQVVIAEKDILNQMARVQRLKLLLDEGVEHEEGIGDHIESELHLLNAEIEAQFASAECSGDHIEELKSQLHALRDDGPLTRNLATAEVMRTGTEEPKTKLEEEARKLSCTIHQQLQMARHSLGAGSALSDLLGDGSTLTDLLRDRNFTC